MSNCTAAAGPSFWRDARGCQPHTAPGTLGMPASKKGDGGGVLGCCASRPARGASREAALGTNRRAGLHADGRAVGGRPSDATSHRPAQRQPPPGIGRLAQATSTPPVGDDGPRAKPDTNRTNGQEDRAHLLGRHSAIVGGSTVMLTASASQRWSGHSGCLGSGRGLVLALEVRSCPGHVSRCHSRNLAHHAAGCFQSWHWASL